MGRFEEKYDDKKRLIEYKTSSPSSSGEEISFTRVHYLLDGKTQYNTFEEETCCSITVYDELKRHIYYLMLRRDFSKYSEKIKIYSPSGIESLSINYHTSGVKTKVFWDIEINRKKKSIVFNQFGEIEEEHPSSEVEGIDCKEKTDLDRLISRFESAIPNYYFNGKWYPNDNVEESDWDDEENFEDGEYSSPRYQDEGSDDEQDYYENEDRQAEKDSYNFLTGGYGNYNEWKQNGGNLSQLKDELGIG